MYGVLSYLLHKATLAPTWPIDGNIMGPLWGQSWSHLGILGASLGCGRSRKHPCYGASGDLEGINCCAKGTAQRLIDHRARMCTIVCCFSCFSLKGARGSYSNTAEACIVERPPPLCIFNDLVAAPTNASPSLFVFNAVDKSTRGFQR